MFFWVSWFRKTEHSFIADSRIFYPQKLLWPTLIGEKKQMDTPWKINMEPPNNGSLEDKFPFQLGDV